MLTMAKAPKKKTAFARSLIALRKRNGDISQSRAAQKIGVSVKTWRSWEQDLRIPPEPTLRYLKIVFPK